MPRPSLYLDECVAHEVSSLLAQRGFDVRTARSAAILGASDETQLAYAAMHKCVITSHNIRDFRRLHRRGTDHSGIFLLPVGAIPLLDIRIALFADWVATLRSYRSSLFHWHEMQQRLIHGERISGYSEDDVRRALGHPA
jgi:predicted nuclease of predicted toxin-antitoxin system